MKKLTEFGKQVKFKLIDLEWSQTKLIDLVKEKTGLYFDSSYLNKVMTGDSTNPKVVTAIREILEIGGEG